MGREVALTVPQILQHVKDLYSIFKKMERVLLSEDFLEMYEQASPQDLIQLKGWIERNEHPRILKWMKTQSEGDLHKLQITRLRLIARRLGIKNWFGLDKINAIEAIELERRKRLFSRD